MKHVSEMTPEEKEAFHKDAESRIERFKYEKPAPSNRPKTLTWLSRSPLLNVLVQTVRDGGDNNLHYHTNSDTTYFVLRGRVRFVAPGDGVWGEFGPMEGIYVPGGVRYRFHKVGEEDLEMMQITADDLSKGKAERISLEGRPSWQKEMYPTGKPTDPNIRSI